MNLEFLKSKSAKIVLAIITISIVILIFIVMMFGDKKGNNKLLLTCVGESDIENTLSFKQTISLYKKDDGFEMLVSNKMSATKDFSNYSKSAYNSIAKSLEHQYDYLNRIDYINYDISYNDEYLIFELKYDITSDTNEQIASEFNYDFLNNSIDQTKTYFEGDEYKCQKF